jgi:hypothetical protein
MFGERETLSAAEAKPPKRIKSEEIRKMQGIVLFFIFISAVYIAASFEAMSRRSVNSRIQIRATPAPQIRAVRVDSPNSGWL